MMRYLQFTEMKSIRTQLAMTRAAKSRRFERRWMSSASEDALCRDASATRAPSANTRLASDTWPRRPQPVASRVSDIPTVSRLHSPHRQQTTVGVRVQENDDCNRSYIHSHRP